MNNTASVTQQWVDIIEPLRPATEISPLLYVFLGILFVTLMMAGYLYVSNDRRRLKRKLSRIKRQLDQHDCQPADAARSVYKMLSEYYDHPILNGNTLPANVSSHSWVEFCCEISRQSFSADFASRDEAQHMINHALDNFK